MSDWRTVPAELTFKMLLAANENVGTPNFVSQLWPVLLEAAPRGPEHPLFEQALDLLAALIDEPLTTLPGGAEAGWPGPLNLYVSAYRPDLSEKVAALLEEAGR